MHREQGRTAWCGARCLVLVKVKTSTLAGLIGVVDRWADSNCACSTCVGSTEVVCKPLEDIGTQVILVDDGHVAGWLLRSLKIGADRT